MRYLSKKIQEILSGLKLRRQLNIIYMVAFFLPMAGIGIFLMINTDRLLINYHKDLNDANNFRVKTIMLEITSQIYTLSENIALDDELQSMLSNNYNNEQTFLNRVAEYEGLSDFLNSYSEIEDIQVYTDNMSIADTDQIKKVTDKEKTASWYQKAIHQESVFWTGMKEKDRYGNTYYNLCLVRQIKLMNTNQKAVMVIKVAENYLKSQLYSSDFELLLYVDDGGIFFCTNRLWYDISGMIYINYKEKYYNYSGQITLQDVRYMTTVSTVKLYNSDNKIYVCNMDNSAYDNIYQILSLCMMIIVAAMILPFLMIRYFTGHFSNRVDTLREAMHMASNENYDVPSMLMGDDEISQAFADLQRMVSKIKDKDAKMYEARINTQQIQNAQQRIEMNVLASQINPHFLYNTLETIRMKAFKAGDRDVATAIKLLGKSMRYVLENTGTSSTTLMNELVYIETYLQIQKLRFEDRVNYSIIIENGLNTEEIEVLPLLIQPIVENAIIHGLEEVETDGNIAIHVYCRDKDTLCIEISDNGCGMVPEELKALREKLDTAYLNPSRNIGLYNINQRIRLCYGPEYGITTESEFGHGTKVILAIPLKSNQENG